jgi:nitroimidazol reductase NimA-like FMN-containing flavoprotein (pyridoxamine 5'-phosphate oxidase superfamily)
MIEAKTMAQIVEMDDEDNKKLLQRVRYGHLACTRDAQPYVVPIHYAYDDPHVYIFTTEGKKTEIISDNPKVCLQVEEVTDGKHWQSVIVTGEAERLTAKEEINRAMDFITAVNPTLTPALSIRWLDNWVRANVDVVYRITPTGITGRTTIDRTKHGS